MPSYLKGIDRQRFQGVNLLGHPHPTQLGADACTAPGNKQPRHQRADLSSQGNSQHTGNQGSNVWSQMVQAQILEMTVGTPPNLVTRPSAIRSASAEMVRKGLTFKAVGMMEPSAT